jgi:hypothetical protein
MHVGYQRIPIYIRKVEGGWHYRCGLRLSLQRHCISILNSGVQFLPGPMHGRGRECGVGRTSHHTSSIQRKRRHVRGRIIEVRIPELGVANMGG